MANEHVATQREHSAVHEAGHAVIGRVLGIPCGHATILADEGSAGHSLAAPPHETLERWWHNLGRYYREEAAAFHARIMTYMAGAEAERVLLGACNGGNGNDLGEIAWMANSAGYDTFSSAWTRRKGQLRRQTIRLLRKHQATVRGVADALMEKGYLASEEIDAWIPRSRD
jgi:ATP-dependent Zn protease